MRKIIVIGLIILFTGIPQISIATYSRSLGSSYYTNLSTSHSKTPGSSFDTDFNGLVTYLNNMSMSTGVSQWTDGGTATKISTTKFSVVTDQTSTYTYGRRIKVILTGGTTSYSDVVSSVYSGSTTVTITDAILSTTITNLYYGINEVNYNTASVMDVGLKGQSGKYLSDLFDGGSDVPISVSDCTFSGQLFGGVDLPDGFGTNYKIVPTISGGTDLVVTLKTIDNSTPAATNPVYIRIGDTVRSVTSTLSLTVPGGTNSFNRNNQTYSLFVYLIWETAGSQINIGISPAPGYLDYPATNPAAPNGARILSAYGNNNECISGAEAECDIVSGDDMRVIGRIDTLVQSNTNTYTSVSAVPINKPVYDSPWSTSPNIPRITVGSGDTAPTFTTNSLQYAVDGQMVKLNMLYETDNGVDDGAGTAGGLRLDLPFNATVDVTSGFCYLGGTGLAAVIVPGLAYLYSATEIQWVAITGTGGLTVLPAHFGNDVGIVRKIQCNLEYRIAY